MEKTLTVEIKVDTTDFELASNGINKDSVAHVGYELEVLRSKGLLVDLNVSGTTMFTRKASFAELGILSDDEKTKRYSAGNKYLIPKEDIDRLRSIETRMRQTLDKYAWDVTGFRPYRWLPWTAYRQFKARWQELAQEFEFIKIDIMNKYDTYLDMISDEFAAGARNTWRAVNGQGYTVIEWGGKKFYTENHFVEGVVEVAQNMMPTFQRIEKELKADYKVALVYGQVDYAKDQAQAELVLAQAKAEKAEVAAKAALAQEELNHATYMHKLEKEKAEIEIEAMIAAEVDHAREQLAEIKSPFEEVFTALRCQIAQDCEEMLASVTKNGFVRGKIAEKAHGLLEVYEMLAVHNDKELRDKLVSLRSQIGVVGGDGKDAALRNTNAVADTMRQIVELAHNEIDNLSDISRAAFLEI